MAMVNFELMVMTTYFALLAMKAKRSRLRRLGFCLQYTNRHIPSTWTTASPTTLSELGASIVWRAGVENLGTKPTDGIRMRSSHSITYAFISDCSEVKGQEDLDGAGETAAKIFVIRDSKSKKVFAHGPSKGVDEKGYSVSALVEVAKSLKYIKVYS